MDVLRQNSRNRIGITCFSMRGGRHSLHKAFRWLMVLVAFCMFPSTAVYAETDITVSPQKEFQAIEGIGGSIVYYLDWLTTHKNKEELYDTLFNGLGLTAFRMANWAQAENANLTYDAEIVREGRLRRGNGFTFIMSSWTAPASLKSNNSLKGNGNGSVKASLKKENGRFVYDKFGDWWRSSLEQYKNVGVVPDYVSIQNEIDCDADYESMVLKTTETSDCAAYAPALAAVHSKLATMQNPPKLLGPEVLGIGWNNVQNYVNTIDKSLVYGYDFHYYHSGLKDHEDRNLRYCYPDDFLWAMTLLSDAYLNEKPMFMDENSTLREHYDMDPIYTAIFLAYAFSVNHTAAYLHWNLIWGDTGDGCINLDFSEKGYNSEKGYTINGDYHALRHYSKFIPRGWKNIDAQTSNLDLIVSAFKSPDDDGYTVVLVNRMNHDETVNLNLAPQGMNATVVVSQPLENIYSQTVGVYPALPSLNAPANSIITIAYRKSTGKYVFSSDREALWTDTQYWTPNNVPTQADTVVIQSGTAVCGALNQSAPLVVEDDGILRLTQDATLSFLFLKNQLLFSEPNATATLHTSLYVNDEASFRVKEPDAIFSLSGEIRNDGNLTKTGKGKLVVDANVSHFHGFWTIEGGELVCNNNTALGANGAYVDGGTLTINQETTTEMIEIKTGANLKLNANLVVTNAIVEGKALASGTYNSQSLPDVIEGDGELVVNHVAPEIVKHGVGGSKQTITMREMLSPFYYNWTNADSVQVVWYPSQPQGITVDLDKDNSRIDFSGVAEEEGLFKFDINVRSGSDVVRKSGSIQILSEPVKDPTSVPLLTQTDHQVLSFAVTTHHLSILVQSERTEECHYMIVDMKGQTKNDFSLSLNEGENHFSRNVNLPQGTYLLLIQTPTEMKSEKMIVGRE